jgi:uncharacterized protein YihD (DUF1040 family)
MFPEPHDLLSVSIMYVLNQMCVQRSTFSGRFNDSCDDIRITFLKVTSMTSVFFPNVLKHYLIFS